MNIQGLLTIGLKVHGDQASDYDHSWEPEWCGCEHIAKLGQEIPFNSTMHKIVKYFCYQNFLQKAHGLLLWNRVSWPIHTGQKQQCRDVRSLSSRTPLLPKTAGRTLSCRDHKEHQNTFQAEKTCQSCEPPDYNIYSDFVTNKPWIRIPLHFWNQIRIYHHSLQTTSDPSVVLHHFHDEDRWKLARTVNQKSHTQKNNSNLNSAREQVRVVKKL